MMMMLAVVRFVQFAACLLIVSVWWVDLALLTPGVLREFIFLGGRWDRQVRGILLCAWPAAVISGALWFWLVAAAMSGQPLSQAMTPDILSTVWNQTEFGTVWKWRCAIGAGAVVLSAAAMLVRRNAAWRVLLSVLAFMSSGAFLGALAWAGHGLVSRRLHLPADVVHLLAASFWPAGLVPFLMLLGMARAGAGGEFSRAAAALTVRFSAMSLLSVALLLGTGVANSFFLLKTPRDLIGSAYGGMLLAKILVFFVAVGFGAQNLLWLKPRIVSAGGDERAAGLLGRNVAVEILLAIVILGIVGVLGLLSPPPA